ncbi:hypothetical protein LEP1GSC193_2608 [Leptospira alstonii serovar Pingchang str. 80-412]|uniref:Uncharacterized protein n=2 Tax=Leptospira alstonii TaxID=28452 RepID=M6D1R2_9LEPT|nr:hypothetical protein LEP1GSC194_2648 [Leptospira alstonii serovar Sichuan str. 79601]EQA81006.1 hypothetical protein LEP1GSC193_2608 [Leptospira alstonii serovar Pingchang str. 80-412]
MGSRSRLLQKLGTLRINLKMDANFETHLKSESSESGPKVLRNVVVPTF